MPLNIVEATLDNVEPAHQSLYVARNGAFHLDLHDLESHVETRVTGLKTALQKERETNGMLKKHISLPPEDLHAALKRVGETPTDVDGLLQQHRAQWDVERANLKQELQISQDSEKAVLKEAVLGAGLTKARATPEGMSLLTEQLGARILLDTVEGKRQIRFTQADGETPMQGTGPGGAATFGDLITESVQNYPSLFFGTGAGGGGKSPTSSTRLPSGKVLTRREFDSLSPHDRAEKMRDGYKLTD